MAEATLYHGDPVMVDYTPAADVAAGEVVVIGSSTFIAHRDIVADETGAVAAGGGVYNVEKGAVAIDGGVELWWDDASNIVSLTDATATLQRLGTSGPAGAVAGDATVVVIHHLA